MLIFEESVKNVESLGLKQMNAQIRINQAQATTTVQTNRAIWV